MEIGLSEQRINVNIYKSQNIDTTPSILYVEILIHSFHSLLNTVKVSEPYYHVVVHKTVYI